LIFDKSVSCYNSSSEQYIQLITELLKIILSDIKIRDIEICLDRCLSKIQMNLLRLYLDEMIPNFDTVNFIQESSERNSSLQVVDYVCGAFGYKYNVNLDFYSQIIRNKVKLEKIIKNANHIYLSRAQS
jgi:hypothetical protein